jgi:hypothetical protein
MQMDRGFTRRIRAGGLIVGLYMISSFSVSASDFDHTHAAYDAILKSHVAAGQVDYKALKADPNALDRYLDELAGVRKPEFVTWTDPQQIAFLANLYNAATLRLIVDHYPVESIKDIGSFFKGPWDQEIVRLFGDTITLNNLEHDILRKDYKEPRLHMALVCAAKGCPPLRNEAYVAERLSEQLDDQSRAYLASPLGMRIDRSKGEVHISSIFKWYGDDFASVPAFISKHSGQDVMGLTIRYLNYDWSLNEP